MRELKLFDPTRKPPNWLGHIREGEYALFFKDLKSGSELKADGSVPAESSCLIFDSLDEALDFAQARVNAVPSLRGDIYDHEGKANQPVASIVHQSQSREDSEPTGWKRIWFGIALLPVGILLIVYDWRHDWVRIWPAFFGIQIVAAGVRLVVWGFGTIENSRKTAAFFRSKRKANATSSSR